MVFIFFHEGNLVLSLKLLFLYDPSKIHKLHALEEVSHRVPLTTRHRTWRPCFRIF